MGKKKTSSCLLVSVLIKIALRSSRPEVFCKKGVLKNFAKFTRKHLPQTLFFNKVAGLRPATLLKKRLWHRCFPVNFAKFLSGPFLTEHLWWLLLTSEKKLFYLFNTDVNSTSNHWDTSFIVFIYFVYLLL